MDTALTFTLPPQEDAPFRDPQPLPGVTPQLDDFQQHPNAQQTDQLGQALRAGLGIGALALLPDLIADLRRTKDPDSRLKFLAMAFKEGGYGTKEDKTSNLPVFHFNFVSGAGTVEVTAVNQPQVEDATYAEPQNPLISKVEAINNDFSPADASFSSILELIDD